MKTPVLFSVCAFVIFVLRVNAYSQYKDTGVEAGVLKNGLTYHIINDNSVTNKIQIYLAIRAGDNQEEKDQLGVAHLLEHTIFDGTRSFRSPVQYFEKLGIAYGKDLNAQTGDTYTLYSVRNVPSKNVFLINEILRFLSESITEAILDSADINNNRGEIEEEYRLGGNSFAIDALSSGRVSCDSTNSNITSEDIMKSTRSFPYSALHRFYKKWYRPALAGVFVVGDINNVAEIKDKIYKNFDLIKDSVEDVPKFSNLTLIKIKCKEDQYLYIKTPLIEKPVIHIYYPGPKEIDLMDDKKRQIISEMYELLIQERTRNLIAGGIVNSSMLIASNYTRKLGNYYLLNSIYPESVKIEFLFKRVSHEFEKIKSSGFTTDEIINAKKAIAGKYSGHSSADQTIYNALHCFLEGSRFMGNLDFNNAILALISGISDQDINNIVKGWFSESKKTFLLVPENMPILPGALIKKWDLEGKDGIGIPLGNDKSDSVATILSLYPEGQLKKIRSDVSKIDLLQRPFSQDSGIEQLHFTNGLKIYLKPVSNEKTGRIYLFGQKYQGDDSKKSFVTNSCGTLIAKSGIADFSGPEISKFSNENGINLTFKFDDGYSEINGSAPFQNVEKLLQLLHLYLTRPKVAQNVIRDFNKSSLRKATSVFSLSSFAYRKLFGSDQYDKGAHLTSSNVLRTFKNYFADLSNYSFVISGDFDKDSMAQQLLIYLGSIHRNLSSPMVSFSNTDLKSPFRLNIKEGREPDKSQVIIHYVNSDSNTYENLIKAKVAANILQTILMKRLREKMGAIYTITVDFDHRNFGSLNDFYVIFSCSSRNVDILISAMKEEINSLINYGISEDVLEIGKQLAMNALTSDLHSSYFWSTGLCFLITKEYTIPGFPLLQSAIKSITSQSIINWMKFNIKSNSAYEFVLYPKE